MTERWRISELVRNISNSVTLRYPACIGNIYPEYCLHRNLQSGIPIATTFTVQFRMTFTPCFKDIGTRLMTIISFYLLNDFHSEFPFFSISLFLSSANSFFFCLFNTLHLFYIKRALFILRR